MVCFEFYFSPFLITISVVFEYSEYVIKICQHTANHLNDYIVQLNLVILSSI